MPISIHDTTTPLHELLGEYGWNSTEENLSALVMVLCGRVINLQNRLEHLEDVCQAEQERPRR